MKRPTIAVVLAQFLDEQEQRLAPKTVAQYRDVVELLQHYLNGYAYLALDALDAKRFERLQHATGDAQREFCQIFGPEHILPNVGEFLGYFMVRKVMAGQELLRASGTVTKKLAAWLHEQGYISERQRLEAVERGGDAARELPRADRLGELLHDEMAKTPPLDPEEIPDEHWVEDFLAIERVEPGVLWFEGGIGPVRVSRRASDLAEVGWGVNIVLAQLRGEWRIVELGFVYP